MGRQKTDMASQITLWLGLIFAVFTTMILSLDFSFNVYAIPLKQTFNFTQTEVELISASAVAGFGGSIYESLITRRFGYKIGYLVAFVVNTGNLICLWLTTVYKKTFLGFPGVIAALHFILGAGACGCNAKLSSIAITNLPPEHTGKVIGVSFAASAASGSFYTALLTLLAQDIEHFFLVVAVIFAVSIGACFLFHRPFIKVEDTNHPLEGNEAFKRSIEARTFSEIVNSTFFHLVFWPSLVEFSVVTTFFNNITSIARSFGSDKPLYPLYLLSVIVTVGRILLGFVFDSFMTEFCGVVMMLATGGLTVLGITLLLTYSDVTSLYVFSVFLGIGIAGAISIPCTVLSIAFGRSNFAYLASVFLLFSAVSCLLFQFLLGHLYDQFLVEDGFCYGNHCFYWSFIVLLVVTSCMVSVHLIYVLRNFRAK